MVINVKGKAAAADLSGLGGTMEMAATPPGTASAPPPEQAAAQAPAAAPVAAPGVQTPASFLMTGSNQQTAMNQVKAVQELRAKLRDGAREFWLNPGEFAKLYFLDGKLIGEGVFDTPMVATHMLQIGGDWVKLVCNKHTEGRCIICDSNAEGSQPNTLQLFTVINTMPYTLQNGPRRGTILPARLQMFAATLKTREKLVSRAKNRGGNLVGSLYQFSRQSKQDSRTGDDIEFLSEVPMAGVLGKYPKLGTMRNAKGEWGEAPTSVYDYSKAYPVLTNAEIASLRPDYATMAGFTSGVPFTQAAIATGFGSDGTAEMDDAIPF